MRRTVSIVLPLPVANVGLNGRLNHYVKNAAFPGYKSRAFWLMKEALKGGTPKPVGLVDVQYTPFFAQARRRDEDNLFGLFKAAQDGIAQAMKVDDFFFHLLPIQRNKTGDCSYFKDPQKKGYVEVNLSWDENG